MSANWTRRQVLGRGGAAAAGVAGLGLAAGAVPAAVEAVEDVTGGGVIAHVRDASTGEVAVFDGERETVVRDRALARSLMRATR